jgi:hypothetical protein
MWQALPSGWAADPHGQAFVELTSVLTVLNLLSGPQLAGCGPTHTCSLEQVLVTVLDGRGDNSCIQILSAYRKWLATLAWGGTIGIRTLLVVTRAASMPHSDIATEVLPTYVSVGEDELSTLPDGVRPNSNSILETAARLYWVSGMSLRSALLCPNLDAVQEELRRVLEPATIS